MRQHEHLSGDAIGLDGLDHQSTRPGEKPPKHRICIQGTLEEALYMLAPKSAEIVHAVL